MRRQPAIVFVLLLATATHAAPLRALLLQQESGDGHLRTLSALGAAGYEVTWIHDDNVGELPSTAAEWRQRWDVVFFGTLALEGGLGKLLSAEQLAALKGFVADGGGLVTVIGEAKNELAELLPLVPGSGAGPREFKPAVVATDHPALRGLPSDWPLFGSRYNSFGKATAKPGATVLLEVPESVIGQSYPFLVAGTFGKGRVVCLNSLWAYSTGLHFAMWDWAPAVFGQLGRWAAGVEPLPADLVKPLGDPTWFWQYDRANIPNAEQYLQHPVITPPEPPLTERVKLRLAPPLLSAVRVIETAPVIRELDAASEITFDSGLVARLDHRGMVSYRTTDGLVLAKEPTNQTPLLLFSGTATPEPLKTRDGEAFVLGEALPEAKAGQQELVFESLKADGPDAVATFGIQLEGKVVGTLTWRFIPRVEEVDGVAWHGVGESFVIETTDQYVEELVPRHRWALGGEVDGSYTFRSGCYSNPRGYGRTDFNDATSQDAGHFRFYGSGQPFQVLGSPSGTLWCYADQPTYVASWFTNQAGSGHIDLVTRLGLGRRKGRIEVPTLWYLFAREPLTHNLWMSAYDHVREKTRREYRIPRMSPVPTGMMRFGPMGFVELDRYAEVLIPLAQRLGFRRIDCGVSYVHDTLNPHHGGLEVLKRLCDRAHEAGIEVGFYCGVAWMKNDFPPMQDHPEWLIRDRTGAPQKTGYDKIQTVSLRSGWWDWSLNRYKELKATTGLDAVWLDSWTMPTEYVNYAEPDARYTVEESVKYVKAISDLGYVTWIEGQSPAGLDSFWYRSDRYADLRGNEFCLFDTSPFAYAGNGLGCLDLFRLIAYHVGMFQDPRLLTDPDAPLTKAAVAANTLMNRAHDTLGFPTCVRETEFGTIWYCPQGVALFAFRDAPVELTARGDGWQHEVLGMPDELTWDGRVLSGRVRARGAVLISH